MAARKKAAATELFPDLSGIFGATPKRTRRPAGAAEAFKIPADDGPFLTNNRGLSGASYGSKTEPPHPDTPGRSMADVEAKLRAALGDPTIEVVAMSSVRSEATVVFTGRGGTTRIRPRADELDVSTVVGRFIREAREVKAS